MNREFAVQRTGFLDVAIAPFSDKDRAVQREIRAALDKSSYIDDEETTHAQP
jgi:hypothetical protein